jgi:hypothetical protein
MNHYPKLPLDHKKLINVPYIQLLEYGVSRALEDKRFTKEEAITKYPKLAPRWDSLATDLLSRAEDGTYIIKAEMFLQYLSAVSLQDSRYHAQRAHYLALLGLSISIILLILRLAGN